MKIECTVEELKELLKKETPVARTTDVVTIEIDENNLINHLRSSLEQYQN